MALLMRPPCGSAMHGSRSASRAWTKCWTRSTPSWRCRVPYRTPPRGSCSCRGTETCPSRGMDRSGAGQRRVTPETGPHVPTKGPRLCGKRDAGQASLADEPPEEVGPELHLDQLVHHPVPQLVFVARRQVGQPPVLRPAPHPLVRVQVRDVPREVLGHHVGVL